MTSAYLTSFRGGDDGEGNANIYYTIPSDLEFYIYNLNSQGMSQLKRWNDEKKEMEVIWSSHQSNCDVYGEVFFFFLALVLATERRQREKRGEQEGQDWRAFSRILREVLGVLEPGRVIRGRAPEKGGGLGILSSTRLLIICMIIEDPTVFSVCMRNEGIYMQDTFQREDEPQSVVSKGEDALQYRNILALLKFEVDYDNGPREVSLENNNSDGCRICTIMQILLRLPLVKPKPLFLWVNFLELTKENHSPYPSVLNIDQQREDLPWPKATYYCESHAWIDQGKLHKPLDTTILQHPGTGESRKR
ncbi:hypothetical protein VNO77_19616 [Canavalia gladiata]|uniref:S-locus glycoprotein domain-containing protein n=1 Tax=Canavalia gladiata TaxID=3824 RepID=A0AAN9LNQ8_CANGL